MPKIFMKLTINPRLPKRGGYHPLKDFFQPAIKKKKQQQQQMLVYATK